MEDIKVDSMILSWKMAILYFNCLGRELMLSEKLRNYYPQTKVFAANMLLS